MEYLILLTNVKQTWHLGVLMHALAENNFESILLIKNNFIFKKSTQQIESPNVLIVTDTECRDKANHIIMHLVGTRFIFPGFQQNYLTYIC